MATRIELLKGIELSMDIADYAISRARALCASSHVDDKLLDIYEELREVSGRLENIRKLAVARGEPQ